MTHLLAHLDDPVSRISAGTSSTVGGLFAVAASDPVQVAVGAMVAVLAPILIAAVNRWIDKRFHEATLKASLAAAQAAVAQLEAELARREAQAVPAPVVPFADPDRRD